MSDISAIAPGDWEIDDTAGEASGGDAATGEVKGDQKEGSEKDENTGDKKEEGGEANPDDLEFLADEDLFLRLADPNASAAAQGELKKRYDEAKKYAEEDAAVSAVLFTPDGARAGVPRLLQVVSEKTGVPVTELVGEMAGKPAKDLSEMTEEELKAHVAAEAKRKADEETKPLRQAEAERQNAEATHNRAQKMLPHVTKAFEATYGKELPVTVSMLQRALKLNPTLNVDRAPVNSVAGAVASVYVDDLVKALRTAPKPEAGSKPVLPKSAGAGKVPVDFTKITDEDWKEGA